MYVVCVVAGLIIGVLIGFLIGIATSFDWRAYFEYKIRLKENATKEMEIMQKYLKSKE